MKLGIKFIADNYGLEHQLEKTKEELQELIVEIDEFKPDTNSKDRIIDEIADVNIMLLQLEYLLGIQDKVRIRKLFKVNRQIERIKSEYGRKVTIRR